MGSLGELLSGAKLLNRGPVQIDVALQSRTPDSVQFAKLNPALDPLAATRATDSTLMVVESLEEFGKLTQSDLRSTACTSLPGHSGSFRRPCLGSLVYRCDFVFP